MDYVENPIVEGKDFESTAKDVNGNFEYLKYNYFSAWEEYGETSYTFTVSAPGTSPQRIGTIPVGDTTEYDEIYVVSEGSLGENTKIDFGRYLPEAGDYRCQRTSANNRIRYVIGTDGQALSVENGVIYRVNGGIPLMGAKISSDSSAKTPTESNLTVKVYVKKLPQSTLDLFASTTQEA